MRRSEKSCFLARINTSFINDFDLLRGSGVLLGRESNFWTLLDWAFVWHVEQVLLMGNAGRIIQRRVSIGYQDNL